MAASVPLPWKTTLFMTLLDYRMLFTAVVCPALAYNSTAQYFQNPSAGCLESMVGGYCPCYGWTLRTRLRKKYGLYGSILGDILSHLCCHCLAIARIWKEAESQTEAKNQEQQQSIKDSTSSSLANIPRPDERATESLTRQRTEENVEVIPCTKTVNDGCLSVCV